MKKILIYFFLLFGIVFSSTLKAQTEEPYKVTEKEVVFKTVGGKDLKMLIYEPQMTEKQNLPAIVFFHGGGWNVGQYTLFQHHAKYLASRGMVAFSPQYRIGSMVPGTTVDQCLMDGKSAMRYIKANAATYGVDPDKIVSSGTSAGGLLGGGVAIIDDFNEATDDLTISPNPCAAVLYCPSILIDRANLNEAYQQRFNGLETELSCYHNVKAGLPPFLVMSGDADTQTTIDQMRLFHSEMEKFGNDSKLVEYAKQGHGFMMLDRSVKYFIATVKETEAFLEQHVSLKGESWIEDYVISQGYDIEKEPEPGVYKVGPAREYKRLLNLWNELLAEDPDFLENELTIYIDEGTYVEGELRAFPNKKVRLIGAGADKTILMRNNSLGAITDFNEEKRYGYLFRSAKNATLIADNFELVCENIGFQNIGGSRVNWGGALVVCEVANQKYTFRNCAFDNIYARQGALVSTNPQNPTAFSLTFENCFIENCGTYNFNHTSGLISLKYGGDVTIKNTTFMTCKFHQYNTDPTKEALDNNQKNGLILQSNGDVAYPTNLLIENVNIINSQVNAETTSFCPQIKITGAAAAIASSKMKNVVMLGNVRTGTPDCDVFIQNMMTLAPSIESSVFNVVKEAEATPLVSYNGTTLGTNITYDTEGVDFIMDGNLPQIFKDENGIKYLKNSFFTSVNAVEKTNLPKVTTYGNKIIVSGVTSSDNILVYGMTGKLIKKLSGSEDKIEILLDKGIYVVKVAENVSKVIL